MADKEIPELTAAGPADGSELVHVVQGSNSRKMMVADFLDLLFDVYEPAEGEGLLFDASTGRFVNAPIAGGSTPIESLIVAASDETTALTTGTGKITFRMPYAFTLTEVRASVGTAPTGAALVVDINEGGVSILSTKLSIDAGEKTSTTAATPAVISDANLANDAEITIDIDQIGSTIAGAGLKVYLIGRKAA